MKYELALFFLRKMINVEIMLTLLMEKFKNKFR